MSKATELDAEIATNVKALRMLTGLTQPQVAGHLGIAYQSYQKMEKPGHSFRVSTLDQLAKLYAVNINGFTTGKFGVVNPVVTQAMLILSGLPKPKQDEAIDSMLQIKYGAKK